MNSKDVKYIADILQKKIVGGTIKNVVCDIEYNNYGLIIIRDGKEYICWVDCDPEGNGPGFINIQEK